MQKWERQWRRQDEIIKSIAALAKVKEDHDPVLAGLVVLPEGPYDYEQGKCYWCGGGWSGQRWTGDHEAGCAFQAALDRLANIP